MKGHIQRTGDLPEGHRGDFKTCPHCGHCLTPDNWDALAHTLVLRPERYRKGCAATVSECPECFESSWVHVELDRIDCLDFPKDFADAAKEESEAQKLQAFRDWGASLCWQCSLLISATTGHSAYRSCEGGNGPAVKTCELFKNMIGE